MGSPFLLISLHFQYGTLMPLMEGSPYHSLYAIRREIVLKRISWALLVCAFGAHSGEEVLSVDRVIPNDIELAFPNESNIQPEQSDFKVNHTVLMSNDSGERWAVVTLTNMATGRRTLTQKHLMAIVADGQRIAPIEFLHSFKANETFSLTINFGESKFPLLSVYSRTGI